MTAFDHDELLVDHHDRLLEAEGKIFALTHLIRELLQIAPVPIEAVNGRLEVMRDIMTLNPADDYNTQKFTKSARNVFENLRSGEPPVRPTFKVIMGGKSDKNNAT